MSDSDSLSHSGSSTSSAVEERYIRLVTAAADREDEYDNDTPPSPPLLSKQDVTMNPVGGKKNHQTSPTKSDRDHVRSKVINDPLLQRCFGFSASKAPIASEGHVNERVIDKAVEYATAPVIEDDFLAPSKNNDDHFEALGKTFQNMTTLWQSKRHWELQFQEQHRNQVANIPVLKHANTLPTLSRLSVSLFEHILSYVDPRTLVCYGKLYLLKGPLGDLVRVNITTDSANERRGLLKCPSSGDVQASTDEQRSCHFYALSGHNKKAILEKSKSVNPYVNTWLPTPTTTQNVQTATTLNTSRRLVEISSVTLRDALTQLTMLDAGSERYSRANGGSMLTAEEALTNRTKSEWTSDEDEDAETKDAKADNFRIPNPFPSYIAPFWVNRYKEHLQKQVEGLAHELQKGETHFMSLMPVGLEEGLSTPNHELPNHPMNSLQELESSEWNHYHFTHDIYCLTSDSKAEEPMDQQLAGLECDTIAYDDEECRSYLLHSNISIQCRKQASISKDGANKFPLPMGPLLVPPTARMYALECEELVVDVNGRSTGRRALKEHDVRRCLGPMCDRRDEKGSHSAEKGSTMGVAKLDESTALASDAFLSASAIRFDILPVGPQSIGPCPSKSFPPAWVISKLLANVTLRTTFFPAHFSSVKPLHDHPKDLLFLFESVQCQYAVGLKFAMLGQESILQPFDEEQLRQITLTTYDARHPFPMLVRLHKNEGDSSSSLTGSNTAPKRPMFYYPQPLTRDQLSSNAANAPAGLPFTGVLADPSQCPKPQDPASLAPILGFVLFPVWVTRDQLDVFRQHKYTFDGSASPQNVYNLSALLNPNLYATPDGGPTTHYNSANRKFPFEAGSARERMLKNRLILLSDAVAASAEATQQETRTFERSQGIETEGGPLTETNYYTSSTFMVSASAASHLSPTRVYPLFPIPILRLYHYLLRSITLLDVQQHSWLDNERRMAVFSRVTSPIGPSSVEFRFFITVLGSGYQRLHTKMVFVGSKYSETRGGCRIRSEYERNSSGLPETTLFVGGYGRVEVDIRPRVRADAYREAAAALHLPVGFPLELLHNVVMIATGSCPWLAQETLGLRSSYNGFGWTNAFDEAFEKEAALIEGEGEGYYYS